MKKLLMMTILTAATVGSTGCMCNGPLMRWAQSHNAWLCGSNQYGGYQQCAPVCCEQAMPSNCCAPVVSNCAPVASSNCCTPSVGNYAPASGTVVTPVPNNTYTP
ncbi:MAG: hypothetical protein AB7O62_16115 [Pirellulales bacterium]